MESNILNLDGVVFPGVCQHWLVSKIFGIHFKKYVDNEVSNFEIAVEDKRIVLTLETLTHNIRLLQQPTMYLIRYNFVITKKNSGKKRVGFFETHFDHNCAITHDSLPHCSICERSLKVRMIGNKAHVVAINESSIFERGHHKYHQKIAAEIEKLYKIVKNISDFIPVMSAHRISRYIAQIPFWLSRWMFMCIWTLRRNENINKLPRDVYLLVAGYIYQSDIY